MGAGEGSSLGRALINWLGQDSRPGGLRSSYTAKGWHAQLRQLTGTETGRKALSESGLSPRTIFKNLSDEEANPTRRTRERIESAYAWMSGKFPKDRTQTLIEISGRVTMGNDSRVRGEGRHSPLRIEGRRGKWARIQRIWESGSVDPEELEDLFVEDVIEEDIGEGSEPWTFDGTAYTVS